MPGALEPSAFCFAGECEGAGAGMVLGELEGGGGGGLKPGVGLGTSAPEELLGKAGSSTVAGAIG